MNLEFNELEDGIRMIKLRGRLDMEGTNLAEPRFTLHCSGENVFVLVDFSGVTYLSSIGIPMLINNAKSIAQRGGRLAILKPQPNVKYILDMTGVAHSIRVYYDLKTALERLKSD